MIGVVVAISFVGAPAPPPALVGAPAESPRSSIWCGLNDPTNFLVLLGFSGEDAAQDHLRLMVEGVDSRGHDENPPTEVHHVQIELERGQVLDAVPVGGFLAITRSIADLGYGDELRGRLREMLATFGQAEGYCGHMLGFTPSWQEETRSFVFGTNRTTLPFPEDGDVNVQLYMRVR